MGEGKITPLMLFGLNPVRAALESGRAQVLEIIVERDKSSARIEEIVSLARGRGLPVRTVAGGELERLAEGIVHQGAAARLRSWPYRDEEELDSIPEAGLGNPFLLLLDHVQDVGNFGAIIRSAHLCGATGLVVPRARAAPVTPAVVRASAGAAVFMDIFQVANLAGVIRKLKKAGVWIYGLEAGGEKNVLRTDLTVPLALVLGGEHQGLSRLVRESCDLLISLPMAGRTGSYNASVAAGIAMFEVMRQRMRGQGNGC